MLLKVSFKSHFKIKQKKSSLKDSRYIFTKNIVMFLLLNKIFIKNCLINVKFEKFKKFNLTFLKAPSRHKKFFHQIATEYFVLKIFLNFFSIKALPKKKLFFIFYYFNRLFLGIGSNTLTRFKFTLVSLFNFNYKLLLF